MLHLLARQYIAFAICTSHRFARFVEPLRTLSCTRFFFFYSAGLELDSDISLTSHSLLRKLTVNLPLGEEFAFPRCVVQNFRYISSPGNISHSRYARCLRSYLVVFDRTWFGEPIRTLSCTRFFFFYLVGLELDSDISLTSHSSLRKLTVNLPLGESFVLTRGAVEIFRYISSLGNIPPRRYARVTLGARFGEPEKNTCSKCFFQRNKSLAGFVKCTSCVKYASRVKCAAAREGIYFISHCDYREQYFTIFARKLFHVCQHRIFRLKI